MNTTAQESTACQSESRLTQQKLGLSNLNPMFQNKSIRRVSIVPCYYNKIKQNSNQLQLCILSSHIIGSYHLSWNALTSFSFFAFSFARHVHLRNSSLGIKKIARIVGNRLSL